MPSTAVVGIAARLERAVAKPDASLKSAMMKTFYLLCQEYGFYPAPEKEIEITACVSNNGPVMVMMTVDLADYADLPVEDFEVIFPVSL